MGKPITDEQKTAFLEFCRGLQEEEEDKGWFTLEMFEGFDETRENGEPLWEFHARNHSPDDTHDILELFGSAEAEFEIEQHGWDDFYAVPAN